jgi:hypothetical protein
VLIIVHHYFAVTSSSLSGCNKHKAGNMLNFLFSVESMGPHGQRTAVIYVKEHATPKKYPRLPGISMCHHEKHHILEISVI